MLLFGYSKISAVRTWNGGAPLAFCFNKTQQNEHLINLTLTTGNKPNREQMNVMCFHDNAIKHNIESAGWSCLTPQPESNSLMC